MSQYTKVIRAEFSQTFSNQGIKPFSLNVCVDIPAKGVTAIFGPSGSGKTSLLRCMSGLEQVQGGMFQFDKIVWQDSKNFVPVHKREQGVVFQEASLFNHLSVEGNLLYALKRSAQRSVNSQSFVELKDVIQLMGVEHLLSQFPASLSGGERQRVAIARALLRQPKILFMDEPLAALDFKRKQEILPYLEQLSLRFDIPIIYISHSLDEVARLADYLLVMDEGRVVTQGDIQDVLSRIDLPISLDNDLGVVIKAKVIEKDFQWHLMSAEFSGGKLWLKDDGLDLNTTIRIRILAKDVSLSLKPQDSSILNMLPAEVLEIANDNDEAMSLVRLKLEDTILISRLTRRSVHHLQLKVGLNVWAQIKSVAILP